MGELRKAGEVGAPPPGAALSQASSELGWAGTGRSGSCPSARACEAAARFLKGGSAAKGWQRTEARRTLRAWVLGSVVAAAASLAAGVDRGRASSLFRFERDTLAFANETVIPHPGSPPRAVGGDDLRGGEPYTRRCFVVCRATGQFRKFARFDPRAPAPDDATLARLVRRIARRPLWKPALADGERIVIPGYADLRTLSARRAAVLQRNLGLGWPTYVRPGNYCLVFPPSRVKERRLAAEVDAGLDRGEEAVLWLTRFPDMTQLNHTVLAFARDRQPRADGTVRYQVYDPNYADAPRELLYNPARGEFHYGKSFYFDGGPVRARAVYRSPWQ